MMNVTLLLSETRVCASPVDGHLACFVAIVACQDGS